MVAPFASSGDGGLTLTLRLLLLGLRRGACML
jgi:hypothetical protein